MISYIDIIKKIINGKFFKNVAVLMSGTAIAQVITFAASPILSRIYEPDSFGLFGIFLAICGIITVISCAKYELAILIPKEDEDALNILILSVGIVFLVSFSSLFIAVLCRGLFAETINNNNLAFLLWWVPISIFFGGLYNAFNYWTTRRKQFNRLAISRVVQAVGRDGTQLGLGLSTTLQGTGLIFGHIIGLVSSTSILIINTYKRDFKLISKNFNKERIKSLAFEHIDFPKYNAPQNFLNSVSQNIPTILLAFFFSPVVVGLYWFSFKILMAPNQLIGNSIRQVFYQRANELINENKSAYKLYLNTSKSLAFIGIIPFILILTFGPYIFSFVFGNEWYDAGRFSQWIIIWWYVGFVNAPSVMMIPILGLQNFQFKYEIVLTVLRIISIIIGGFYSNEILAISLFSLTGFFANIFLILFVGQRTKNHKS